MARVLVARSASAALKELDCVVAEAVLDALGELERDPVVGHALRGRLTGLRSYRVGTYRIIYQLSDDLRIRW
jgi:mRNA-degrading endonuclease RelE of RelBE toxin-antitoxin system